MQKVHPSLHQVVKNSIHINSGMSSTVQIIKGKRGATVCSLLWPCVMNMSGKLMLVPVAIAVSVGNCPVL